MSRFTEEDVERVLNENPLLTYEGWGISLNPRRETKKDLDAWFRKYRDLSFEYKSETAWLANWMSEHMEPTKTIYKGMGSYGLKHLVEHFVPGCYVSNGEFICAALVAGFKMEINPNLVLNPRFGISKRSLKRITEVRCSHEQKGRGRGRSEHMVMPPKTTSV